ncbi:hypothetical protein ACJO5Y_02960 [Marinobacter sp. GN3S48]|uniref:hypothetical protein n=1 Tax=Marinobacter sp. GN3S48 TaxID=3382302 RepID=UPI00387ADA35
MKSSMTERNAMNIIRSSLRGNESAKGMCNAHTNRNDQPAQLVGFRDMDVVYTSTEVSFKGFENIRNLMEGRDLGSEFEDQIKTYSLNLSEVNKVRVMNDVDYPNCPKKGAIITLYTGVANSIKAHIGSNEDEFMAAISSISPEARLMEGVGL